jgi:8-oxo-dGTP pyrophosphatase MutT (NUDIX family)
MNQPVESIPAGFDELRPKPLPSFENSGDVFWHKLGRASIDFAALKDTQEEHQTSIKLKAPNKPWYRALSSDPRFSEIQWFKDPTGRMLPPNRYGHPDFMQVFTGYPEIPVEGQGDELGEIFTEAADTVVLRHGAQGIEVLLIQRASGYYALPGGIRAQKDEQNLYVITQSGAYQQIPEAKESAVETAKRALREKAGIDLPLTAFGRIVYSGIVDDVRNSSGAAMYSTVFAYVDETLSLKTNAQILTGIVAPFIPLQELLKNRSEPTLGGLWGSHAYFLKQALWHEYVVQPERFNALSEDEHNTLRAVLSHDPLDTLLDDEVTYSAQNQWASVQWNHRVPWPVRGPLMMPLDGGELLPGMEKMQGHLGLVPAWILKKARRLPDYSIEELISDLELHRDNHSDIPEHINFRYLEALKNADPLRVRKWLEYLGKEAIEVNHVWVRSAMAILNRLGIDKKKLGALQPGTATLESLLELKRQMMAVESARSIAELVQMLAENDQAKDFMVVSHTAWRETTYKTFIQPGQITANPYRPGERSSFIRALVLELIENIRQDLNNLAAQVPPLNASDLASQASKTIGTRVTNLRKDLEANPTVSGAQTFAVMLQIGKMLENLAADRSLLQVFRNQIQNQMGNLVYVVKMDANSAVISGILNAARKQGARLKYKIEPEQ